MTRRSRIVTTEADEGQIPSREAFREFLQRKARFARSAKRQLRRTAHHEAGHAVFFVARRITFDWVIVMPQRDDPDCLDAVEGLGPFDYGRVHSDGVLDLEDAGRVWSEQLTGTLVGPAAEARYLGVGRIRLVGGDLEAARSFLGASGQLDEGQALRDHLALAGLFVDEHWHRIQAVAAALVEDRHLTAARVRKIVGPLPRRRPNPHITRLQ